MDKEAASDLFSKHPSPPTSLSKPAALEAIKAAEGF